jgi:hypothetical protein
VTSLHIWSSAAAAVLLCMLQAAQLPQPQFISTSSSRDTPAALSASHMSACVASQHSLACSWGMAYGALVKQGLSCEWRAHAYAPQQDGAAVSRMVLHRHASAKGELRQCCTTMSNHLQFMLAVCGPQCDIVRQPGAASCDPGSAVCTLLCTRCSALHPASILKSYTHPLQRNTT